MRNVLFTAAFAATSTLAHQHIRSTRKSLAFGPVHPHAKFETAPAELPPTFAPTSTDPKDIARRFVDELVQPEDETRRHQYFIRSDSYQDSTTGVTHVYFRQLVNGLEVADGNLNVNVLDGKVISYGDSFFKGARPPHGADPSTPDSSSQQSYCSEFANNLQDHGHSIQRMDSQDQMLIGNNGQSDHITQLYFDQCSTQRLGNSYEYVDAATAAVHFMVAAHPDSNVQANIMDNLEDFIRQVEVVQDHHSIWVPTDGHSEQSLPVEHLHNVPGTVGPVRARLAYVQTPEHECHTSLALVWKLEVPMENNWYEAAVSASDATRIVEVLDWASDSSSSPRYPGVYNVWKWGLNDPDSGDRSLEVSPYDEVASPFGWHSLPKANDPRQSYSGPKNEILNETTTFGNNVFAHEDWEGRNNWLSNYRPDGGKDLAFNFTYELQTSNGTWADYKSYIDVAVTQLFYTCNKIHDLYYRYGFDEAAGNFQQFNFGKGGKENDGVIANAQDGSGFNNANFMTPPDGQNGRMRMYVWNVHGAPFRDGDLESGIVIHEYSHGLSTRLTGGPADSGCLGWGESGGMGEGWGDALATFIRSVEEYSDYPMGSWAANETRGIRHFPYSTNSTTNPSTYHTLDKGGYWGVHAIGEVWAEILFVVENRLVEKYGFSPTLFPPVPLADGSIPSDSDFYQARKYTSSGQPKRLVPKHGNSLIVQLIFDGMKLQPCRPGFFEARDAIIQADHNLTGGDNFCLLWSAFAERGLGVDSTVQGRTPWGGGVRKDGFALPKQCRTVTPEPEEPEEPEPSPEDPDKKKKKHEHHE